MTSAAPDPPETGYEVTTGLIGRPSRRRWAAAGIAILVLVAVVVVKPWGEPMAAPGESVTARSSAASSTRPTPSTATRVSAAPLAPAVVAAETWPVTNAEVASSDERDSRDPSTNMALAKVVGTWGVAALGNGPRFVRDEPWVDWSAVAPEESTHAADRIATWPATGVCTDLPVILDSPVFVAVTTPVGLALDSPIEGWWSDGGRTASLDGSIRELSRFGRRGVSYLERIDGSRWPAGRYEFHVGGGDQVIALVVCLRGAG